MKLRLRGNSIRLRLSQSEVNSLASEGKLSEETRFAPGQSLIWTVESSVSEKQIRTEYTPSGIRFHIPKDQVESWANSNTVGLYDEGPSRIAIEKDFKCLEARKDEDERDAYPNPSAAKG